MVPISLWEHPMDRGWSVGFGGFGFVVPISLWAHSMDRGQSVGLERPVQWVWEIMGVPGGSQGDLGYYLGFLGCLFGGFGVLGVSFGVFWRQYQLPEGG